LGKALKTRRSTAKATLLNDSRLQHGFLGWKQLLLACLQCRYNPDAFVPDSTTEKEIFNKN
jgi:hypothetical protein